MPTIPAIGQEDKAAGAAAGRKPAAAQGQKPAKMLDGLLIKRYSWLGGDVEIAVTPEFLSISSPTRSGVTVSRAPFKTVVAYDSARKTYYETTPEAAGSFMIQRFLKILGGDPHPKKWKKVEDGVIAGVKAGRYVVDNAGLPAKHYTDKGEKVVSQMRNSGFWVAENLDIPPGAADIVLKMEGFPTIHKLPLKFQKPKPEAGVKPRVDTYSVKKTSFKPERFQIPSGYHKTGAEYSLQTDELELFGGGDPAGKSIGKKH
ncbi:MAG: hypothetical protein IT342_08255 [Candidatus Melainabacteria bacterium]|nr:hypothetical protein [Candidatus Melainabacteria bacterium]